MARSRNIKPAIMDNESLADLPPLTRLLFIYIWMLADREGRLEDRPARIAVQALPYDRDVDAHAILDALQASGFIVRFSAAGKKVIQITNFVKHQAPHGTERDSDLPDAYGLLTVHVRGKNGYATGEKQLVNLTAPVEEQTGNSAITVKHKLDNLLIPDSLIPDSLSYSDADASGTSAGVASPMSAKDTVWTLGPALLGEKARGLLGKLVATHGEDLLAEVLSDCAREKPGEPKAWIVATCAARQDATKSGAGAANGLMSNPTPRWALSAGFTNRFEAENAGCTERNHRQFAKGQRVAA